MTAVPRYYPLPPITAIELYSNDVRVKRTMDREAPGGGKRQRVQWFSKAARRRLAFTACNTDVVFLTMITLTYPNKYETDGVQFHKHLAAFLEWMRRNWEKPSYLWFLEFQKRGAPHFHILITRKRQRGDIQAVALAWYNIVASGDEKHLLAGTRTERIRKADGAKRYAVKYAFKMKQKVPPKDIVYTGRFYGYSRDVKPKVKYSTEIDETSLRILLEKWEWAPGDDQEMFPVLYGAAKLLQETIGQENLTTHPIRDTIEPDPDANETGQP